eukprot:353102-Chlamydomonas_euryale.AAC.6
MRTRASTGQGCRTRHLPCCMAPQRACNHPAYLTWHCTRGRLEWVAWRCALECLVWTAVGACWAGLCACMASPCKWRHIVYMGLVCVDFRKRHRQHAKACARAHGRGIKPRMTYGCNHRMARYDVHELLRAGGGLARVQHFLPAHVADGLLALLESYPEEVWNRTAANEDYAHNNISHVRVHSCNETCAVVDVAMHAAAHAQQRIGTPAYIHAYNL